MSSAERIMRMFYELSREGGFVSKSEVIQEYNITDRQLRRDIEYIRERILSPLFPSSDLNIVSKRIEGQSYYMIEGDVKELEELRARSLISDAVSRSALDPIRAIIEDQKDPFSKYIKFLSNASELPDYTLFTKLLRAIEKKHRIELEYRRIGKEPFTTVLEPLELINYSALWYLRAYNIALSSIRTYSLSRIINIKELLVDITFTEYEMLKKEDESSYGIYSSSSEPEIYTIRFKGSPAFIVANQLWHKDQTGHFISDDVYELSLPAVNMTELLAKTLSFGENAWPIAPESFVNAYKAKVSEMARLRL